MQPQSLKTGLAMLALVLSPLAAFAQKHTLSGTITDAATGEALIGATVVAVSSRAGTTSNAYGFYSLTLPEADSLTVLFSFLGYRPQLARVDLTVDRRIDVALVPGRTALGEVTVTGERAHDENVQLPHPGVVDVPLRSIETLPAILGEQDVLKVIQLLPGVQAGQEGTTGFFVRGGNIDQNLVQLDEATVYNPNHLFGLFSTFNTRALNNVRLVKGGFPAYYGGRLSSVLEISMREGNRRRYVTQGGLGLISSQLSVEGPIRRDEASFIVSGRRSYLDLLLRPFQRSANKNLYYFYDVNAKVNARLSPSDRIYGSLFTGRDDAEYVDASSLGYAVRFGNSTATLRWNHLFGGRIFANTSLIANKYFIRVNTNQGKYFSQNYSGIADQTGKVDVEYYPSPAHEVRMGGVVTRHVFRSTGNEGRLPPEQGLADIQPTDIPRRHSVEAAAYVNEQWQPGGSFGMNVGVRVPYFATPDTTYLNVEPRVSVKLGVGRDASLKASYTLMNQYVHLVPSSTAAVPTDIWTPSSRTTKPEHAWQTSLGYFRNFQNDTYEASIEVYYKQMERQVLFQEGAQLLAFSDVDSVLTYGHGWSYGAELFLKRDVGRLTGWASYTLSWTRQRFAALNGGDVFPFRFDRRHNLALTATYDFNDHWTLSANFVFQTGPAYTLPVGRLYARQGGDLYEGLFFDYDHVNNYRLGPYNRLDVAGIYHFRPWFFDAADLVISVYNVYSRLNPYFVYLDVDPVTGEPTGRQVTLLPIVPSVNFNFRF